MTQREQREARRAIPVFNPRRKPTFLDEYYVARSYASYTYFKTESEARAFASERPLQPWDIGKVVNNGPVERIEYIEAICNREHEPVGDFMKELGL
jgi:hypothetical protein